MYIIISVTVLVLTIIAHCSIYWFRRYFFHYIRYHVNGHFNLFRVVRILIIFWQIIRERCKTRFFVVDSFSMWTLNTYSSMLVILHIKCKDITLKFTRITLNNLISHSERCLYVLFFLHSISSTKLEYVRPFVSTFADSGTVHGSYLGRTARRRWRTQT